jgi:hypothetical protein
LAALAVVPSAHSASGGDESPRKDGCGQEPCCDGRVHVDSPAQSEAQHQSVFEAEVFEAMPHLQDKPRNTRRAALSLSYEVGMVIPAVVVHLLVRPRVRPVVCPTIRAFDFISKRIEGFRTAA